MTALRLKAGYPVTSIVAGRDQSATPPVEVFRTRDLNW
jgi:hypothetical protein